MGVSSSIDTGAIDHRQSDPIQPPWSYQSGFYGVAFWIVLLYKQVCATGS